MRAEPKIKPQLKLLVIKYLGECGGNAVKSAIAAGYSENYAKAQSYKLLERKDVQEYMQWLRENQDCIRDIMELQDLQEFWTSIIKDCDNKTMERLRASELLAKSKGAFNDW